MREEESVDSTRNGDDGMSVYAVETKKIIDKAGRWRYASRALLVALSFLIFMGIALVVAMAIAYMNSVSDQNIVRTLFLEGALESFAVLIVIAFSATVQLVFFGCVYQDELPIFDSLEKEKRERADMYLCLETKKPGLYDALKQRSSTSGMSLEHDKLWFGSSSAGTYAEKVTLVTEKHVENPKKMPFPGMNILFGIHIFDEMRKFLETVFDVFGDIGLKGKNKRASYDISPGSHTEGEYYMDVTVHLIDRTAHIGLIKLLAASGYVKPLIEYVRMYMLRLRPDENGPLNCDWAEWRWLCHDQDRYGILDDIEKYCPDELVTGVQNFISAAMDQYRQDSGSRTEPLNPPGRTGVGEFPLKCKAYVDSLVETKKYDKNRGTFHHRVKFCISSISAIKDGKLESHHCITDATSSELSDIKSCGDPGSIYAKRQLTSDL